MSVWYMLTIVGRDQPGIVAEISNGLFELGCQLGETSMMRLGGNFTMMLMVNCDCSESEITQSLQASLNKLDLHLHIDRIEAHLHEHVIPNLRVSVYGMDRPGIVARVTKILQQQGFNILDLESDVAGSDDKPIYIMHIEGQAENSAEDLERILLNEAQSEIDIKVLPIDTVVA